jgi:hypothetical protein
MLFIAVCSLASSVCLANEVSYSVDANENSQISLREDTFPATRLRELAAIWILHPYD